MSTARKAKGTSASTAARVNPPRGCKSAVFGAGSVDGEHADSNANSKSKGKQGKSVAKMHSDEEEDVIVPVNVKQSKKEAAVAKPIVVGDVDEEHADSNAKPRGKTGKAAVKQSKKEAAAAAAKPMVTDSVDLEHADSNAKPKGKQGKSVAKIHSDEDEDVIVPVKQSKKEAAAVKPIVAGSVDEEHAENNAKPKGKPGKTAGKQSKKEDAAAKQIVAGSVDEEHANSNAKPKGRQGKLVAKRHSDDEEEVAVPVKQSKKEAAAAKPIVAGSVDEEHADNNAKPKGKPGKKKPVKTVEMAAE